MSELTGKIEGFNIEFMTGNPILTLRLNEKSESISCYEKLKHAEMLTIKISKYREKRSLDANRYMWKLCGEIAKKLSAEGVLHTKEDIYRDEISKVGVWYDDEIEPEKVQRRRTAWEMIGTGWLTERVDFTQDGEKEIIRFYYGSSQYNTKQMSRLIDNIVQDCQAMGIETRTPNEIAEMLSLWESEPK